jgi:hypothetical protein
MLASLAIPVGASAQYRWDVPPLVSPYAPQGPSVLLVGADRGEALGGLLHWRHDTASLGLGYRAGVVQDGHTSVFAGVDVSGYLARQLEEADVAVTWWSGLGAGVSDELTVSVPLGLMMAWRGLGEGNVFAPYAGAHTTLDLSTRPGDHAGLDASLDVGLDLTLVSGWIVRFGASFFGPGAVGIGLRIPGPRAVD